jgi:hypothetical protein
MKSTKFFAAAVLAVAAMGSATASTGLDLKKGVSNAAVCAGLFSSVADSYKSAINSGRLTSQADIDTFKNFERWQANFANVGIQIIRKHGISNDVFIDSFAIGRENGKNLEDYRDVLNYCVQHALKFFD